MSPGLSNFSAPTTNATSAKPDAIYENAETRLFAPELHKLSTECEILGDMPASSDVMFAKYLLLSLVEVRTTSTSF